MVKRARASLAVMITHGGMRRSIEYRDPGRIPPLPPRGRAVPDDRGVRPTDPARPSRGFPGRARRYPVLEIRQLFPQSARVTIVDDREVLIFPVPNGQARGVQEVAIWTDNPDFIRSQSLYFDGMWERAGPATWRAPAPGPGSARRALRDSPCGSQAATWPGSSRGSAASCRWATQHGPISRACMSRLSAERRTE